MTFREKLKRVKVGDEIVFQHFVDNHLITRVITKIKDDLSHLDGKCFWFKRGNGSIGFIKSYEVMDINLLH